MKSIRQRERRETAYREIHRKVMRLVRQDKRRVMYQLATEAEEASAKREQVDSTSSPKDRQGKLLTIEKDHGVRWKEHFKDNLNKPHQRRMRILTLIRLYHIKKR